MKHRIETEWIYFQIIAGVTNIHHYENRKGVQVRGISNVYTPSNADVDLAIIKVNVPFLLNNYVKAITLAQAGFIPPGNKHFSVFYQV